MAVPRTRYAPTREGVCVAYQVFGDGPYDLVYSPGWVTNIEVLWEWPGVARVFSLDGKLGGLAVNIGARVGAIAAPSEILVSQTVKDLTAGSGLALDDAGEHDLKGIPDRWRVYRVVS